MALLPAYDARFLDLGETQSLVNYAREMGSLLHLRWDQHQLRMLQDFHRHDLPEEERQLEMQTEEYLHKQFEQLLGAQVLMTAFSMLQGSVDYCSEYIAEQRGITKRLDAPHKWEIPPAKDVPTEAIWKRYYEEFLKCEFPLDSDIAQIRKMRLLRNSYGHSLHFEDVSEDSRRQIWQSDMTTGQKETAQSLSLHYFDSDAPGVEYAELHQQTRSQAARARR